MERLRSLLAADFEVLAKSRLCGAYSDAKKSRDIMLSVICSILKLQPSPEQSLFSILKIFLPNFFGLKILTEPG